MNLLTQGVRKLLNLSGSEETVHTESTIIIVIMFLIITLTFIRFVIEILYIDLLTNWILRL